MHQEECIRVKFSEGLGIFDQHYGSPQIDEQEIYDGPTGKVIDIQGIQAHAGRNFFVPEGKEFSFDIDECPYLHIEIKAEPGTNTCLFLLVHERKHDWNRRFVVIGKTSQDDCQRHLMSNYFTIRDDNKWHEYVYDLRTIREEKDDNIYHQPICQDAGSIREIQFYSWTGPGTHTFHFNKIRPVPKANPYNKNSMKAKRNDGVWFYPIKVKRVFHPVQHQFKIHERAMEQDADGNSRRRNEDGDPCDSPNPQDIHPACYPASWASLCSSYRMTPLHPRRRWEMGTPTELNPPPNEFGDFFSTWAMGTERPGNPPRVTRVEDWQANPTDPTPDSVIMETLTFPATADEEEREERAALIKSALLRKVGGQISLFRIVLHSRPVRMAHSGHAWVIVGVDKNGFWEHALARDAWAFSNYCLWEEAPWIDDGRAYNITFPPDDCALKPEERRLGCINLEGSSDKMKRVRFWDVYTGLGANIINWTPHTRTDPGYLWIRGNEPLTCLGFPESVYHPDLGHIIARPIQNFGHCPRCGNSEDGCSRCRLRLLLPFWVHNTTLDELVTYKVDLYFWSKDQRWVTLDAKPLPENSRNKENDLYCGFGVTGLGFDRWTEYKLPGPLPGERFSIKAEPDPETALSRPEPWNSQGFAWYIDFHRNQLTYGVHGIRLVLTCIERSAELLCLVQDVKQIWFRVSDPAPT